MNKITIFAVVLLVIMSFIVESVYATEASEVLRARLAVRKNTLRAGETKMGDAKVDVGVDSGVVAKKTQIGLQSQNKLAAQLRKRGHIVVEETSAEPTNQQQNPPQSVQQKTSETPQTTQTVQQQKTSETPQQSFLTNTSINITEVIAEYIQQLESKIQIQTEALMTAIEKVRQAEKERNVEKVAVLLTQLKDLEEAFAKAVAAETSFQTKQAERVEQNKKIIGQWMEDAKKAKAEQKAQIKAQIETIIEHIRPSLELAENTYKEKKTIAQREVVSAVQAVKNALAATREFLVYDLKVELALRYPNTAAALGFFGDVNPNQATITVTTRPSFLQRESVVVTEKINPSLVAVNSKKLKLNLAQLH